MVETCWLTKSYGSFLALDDCNLEIRTGEVFGLLGPNGAGKTTLIRLLLGFLRPSAGHATVDGFDCFRQSVEVRQRLSYLPAEAKLFRRMRGRDVLDFFTSVRGTTGDGPRAIELAKRLDLDIDRRVALMSTGMRQKLALAATMAHETPLLILDEPTANLDPTVRREVARIVAELKSAGRTILLSSHVLPEVEETCDRVAILRQGRTVHLQDMRQLRRRHRVTARGAGPFQPTPVELREHVQLTRTGEQVEIQIQGDIGPLLPWLATLELEDMKIEPYGLHSIYDRYHWQGDEE